MSELSEMVAAASKSSMIRSQPQNAKAARTPNAAYDQALHTESLRKPMSDRRVGGHCQKEGRDLQAAPTYCLAHEYVPTWRSWFVFAGQSSYPQITEIRFTSQNAVKIPVVRSWGRVSLPRHPARGRPPTALTPHIQRRYSQFPTTGKLTTFRGQYGIADLACTI